MNPVLRVAGLALLAVLAGCSTPPERQDHVVTLETTGSSPAAPMSSAPPPSRPRERLDMTAEESEELYQLYNQCLTDHGVGKGVPSGGTGATPVEAPSRDTEEAANAACLATKPLPPWEYDVANPESADFVHAVVQCLRDKGVRYVDEEPVVPGEDRRVLSFGGPNNDPESISKGLDLVGTCEKESAHR